MNKHNKFFLFITAIPPLFTLSFYGYLGGFTRLMADDFCSMYYAERFGFLRSIWYWRLNWSGRYSAFAVDWLITKFFGANNLYLIPPIVLALWLFFSVYAIHTIFRQRTPYNNVLPDSITTGAIFLFSVFLLTPDIPQSFYWMNGMRSYGLPMFILTVYAFLFQIWFGNPEANRTIYFGGIAGFVMFFFNGGLSETYAVFQFIMLGFFLGAKYVLSPSKKTDAISVFLLAGLLGAMVSLAVIISAPGNAVRQEQMIAMHPGVVELGIISIQAYTQFLFDLTRSPEKATALLGSILFMIWLGNMRAGDIKIKGATIPALIGMGFLLSFICFPPGVFGYIEAPPLRVMIIPVFALIACLYYAGFLAGSMLKMEKGIYKNAVILAAMLFIGFSAVTQAQTMYQERKVYIEYAANWDKINADILKAKANGESSITVPAIENWAKLNILNDNPKFWVNVCYSSYYKINILGSSSPSISQP